MFILLLALSIISEVFGNLLKQRNGYIIATTLCYWIFLIMALFSKDMIYSLCAGTIIVLWFLKAFLKKFKWYAITDSIICITLLCGCAVHNFWKVNLY